ncbi:acyl-CoA Delta-9 desaturase [Calliphora vicina]|uniref:acyl-CoA Delta-9 desaturase n=1 Tax=Calliphora vicina TaxID=7373 RepID=UPI00325B3B5C
MGHLSTSERVSTTSCAETTQTTTNTALKQRLTNGKQAATNGFPTANGQPLVSAADGEVKVIQNKYNVNLEEYTRKFKGDNVLGIQFKAPLKWHNVILIFAAHIFFVVCLAMFPLEKLRIQTLLWAFFMGGVAGFGVTGGAHRFWTHRSFKANVPLRSILMICFSAAGQNSLYDWVRDHRVHHKYSETDADPHNSNRGFFFSHVGWLMMHKHPEVLRRGRQIDMGDILADPVIRFHEKYFIPLKMIFCFLLPTAIPMYFWGEEFQIAFMTQCVFRYISSLNFTWSVNSAAHMWGTRPFDKRINPSENVYVSIIAMGEGWHNYHHVFPWDYKAAELGKYLFNFTTMVLDTFARIGWAWDMKQPSKELVKRTLEKYGDGTHPSVQNMNLSHDGHMNCHIPEVPDPELESLHDEDEAESSSTESTKLDENENENMSKKSMLT